MQVLISPTGEVLNHRRKIRAVAEYHAVGGADGDRTHLTIWVISLSS